MPGALWSETPASSCIDVYKRQEYAGTDEGITVEITDLGVASAKVLHPTSREKVLFFLMEVPFGIQKMSGSIDGLVETSTNIGIVKLGEDEFLGSSSVRSSCLLYTSRCV